MTKESMHFVEEKCINFNNKKKKNGVENGKSHIQFERKEPCAAAHIRIINEKKKRDELELINEKREFFISFTLSKGIFLTFGFYLNV